MTDLKQIFAEPPREYRPMPQWSWNGDITRERITEQLEQFAAQGCGGLFMHARPGYANGYITQEWFDLWAFALEEAQRLGIEFHIYDEFTVPGGVAGGNTIAEDPTVIQHELQLQPVGTPISGDILAHVKLSRSSTTLVQEEDASHVIALVPCSGKDILPPPDILQKETVEAFIRTTHEKYRECVGESFGQDARYVFCDEPHLHCATTRLPCSRDFMREFYLEHGYALEDHVAELCLNTGKFTEVRFDFWKTVDRLFNQNFMKPLYDWCGENDLMFSGHLIENRWPSPLDVASNMSSLRWMHAPGEDLLGFQFDDAAFDKNKLYLLNLKELSSIRNQLGREWTLVETCGGGGYNESLPYFKSCEDFVLAAGVNVIDPHLAHVTLSGIGKYDWPQTLSDHSPWWQFYRAHADHVARVNAALSQGHEYNRVLLLMPTTTAWSYYTGREFDAVSGNVSAEKLDWIKESQLDICFDLYQRHIDFDLGDELLLQDLGRAEDGALIVGERRYDAVIIPPAMENLMTSTRVLLQDVTAGGGRVLARCRPSMIDGRRTEPIDIGQYCASTEDLIGALAREFDFPFAEMPGDLIMRRVTVEEGELFFFANPWPDPIETDVTFEGRSIRTLDSATGEIGPAAFERVGDRARCRLNLASRGHALWLVTDDEIAPAKTETPPRRTLHPQFMNAQRLKPNLLYVDYCDIEVYGERREDINTVHAETFNWKKQGFTGIPWRRQFRRTIIDRTPKTNSTFTVSYRFMVADDFAGPLQVGIERPWLYELSLNDAPLRQDVAERWFDPDIRAIPLDVQPGENVLTLTARPFHVLCAIMPVYILGEFSLTPIERGFRIDPPRELGEGDWTQQGLPFYADAVRYEYTVTLDADTSDPILRLAPFDGPVARVSLDGRELGQVVHSPYEIAVPGPVAAGAHTLTVDVFGNMKNMMGSHFSDALPGMWSFEYNPESMPAGEAYEFTASGNRQAPELLI